MQPSLLTKSYGNQQERNPEPTGKHQNFVLREPGQICFYQQSEIARCEAHSNYTKVIFHSGKVKWVSKCLKVVSAQLSQELFIRIHAKHLINRNAISSIAISPSRLIHLVNGNTVPIARSKYQSVKNLIQKSSQAQC